MGCSSSKQVQITQTNGTSQSEKSVRGDLYFSAISPPSRSSLMTCAALGIKPNLKPIDLAKGETRTPEFEAINPFKTVPTYVDGDFHLWESRAINAYLVHTFGGADNSLYPRDPKKRARIDNVLNADATTFYKASAAWVFPQLFAGAPSDEEKLKEFKDGIKALEEHYLANSKFVAGDELTIADFSVIVTIILTEIPGLDLSEYPKIEEWKRRMKALPYFDKCNKAMYEMKAARDAKKNSERDQ